MNRFRFPETCCCFIALFSTTLSHGHAQVTMAMDQNQQSNTSIALAPLPGPAQIGVISARGGFAFQESAETVKDQPYQAQATTEIQQTLADGSHIVQTTTATVARDSEGRTVRIQKLSAIGPWRSAAAPEGNSTTLTSIFDPVAKMHIDYTSDTKVAHELPLPPELPSGGAATMMAREIATGSPDAPGPNVMFSVKTRTGAPAVDKEETNAKTESLGTKSIEGVQVSGTRVTNTIPAGAIGNDKDIVVTRETWYSPDLKLVIQSTQNDPRFGETTYSLTNIQRNEPDETLFQIPTGYKIEKPRVTFNTHPQ